MLRAYLTCPPSLQLVTLKITGEHRNVRTVPLKEVTRSDTLVLYVTEMDEPFYFFEEICDVLLFATYPDRLYFTHKCHRNNERACCTEVFPDHVPKYPHKYISSESRYIDVSLEVHFISEEDV